MHGGAAGVVVVVEVRVLRRGGAGVGGRLRGRLVAAVVRRWLEARVRGVGVVVVVVGELGRAAVGPGAVAPAAGRGAAGVAAGEAAAAALEAAAEAAREADDQGEDDEGADDDDDDDGPSGWRLAEGLGWKGRSASLGSNSLAVALRHAIVPARERMLDIADGAARLAGEKFFGDGHGDRDVLCDVSSAARSGWSTSRR